MKKLLFLVLLLSNFIGRAQYTLIPDANFQQALILLGIDNGAFKGKVSTSSISGIKSLDIRYANISDLTGIEGFINLETLLCGNNNLKSLDLSKNTSLMYLDCDSNQLNNLNISKNLNLKQLGCNTNQLTSIDISKNLALTGLGCSYNQLKTIDISKNTVLSSFYCTNNQLTNIDTSNNSDLSIFVCYNNQLTSLDISKNLNVNLFSCSNNQLTSLDISKNKNLGSLQCAYNDLTSANLKNGNNRNLNVIDLTQNKNLICIQVDNVAYSNANWLSSSKDTSANYSENCGVISSITPPVIKTEGNQAYCPGTPLPIVESVSITFDPLEPTTDAVYIQISSGYVYGPDLLTLSGINTGIDTSWIAAEGKLKLYSIVGSLPYATFETAIKNVMFSTTSTSGNRTFSISLGIGQLSYLPSNKHFYEYVPFLAISWKDAKDAAAKRTYYGLKGYLATITSAAEAQLAGAQAPGAGWIGGTNESTPNVWKWVTGPEGLANGNTGTVFWNGGINGTTLTYANWNSGEPNNLTTEFYAHIVAPGTPSAIAGSWNNLQNAGDPNGFYQAKGYIVEYGELVPGDVDGIQISASTTLTIAKLTIITSSPVICASTATTLQATSTTGTINWFDSATGGTLLETGNTFTTPILNRTTTYYIDNGCTSRTPIIVTVNPLPIANPVVIPRQCDDNQDGIFTFNTSNLETTLLNGQNISDVTVTYFDQNNNPLPSPFPASFKTTSQTIKAIVTNKSPLRCFSETKIKFIIDDLPEAHAVPASLTTTCEEEPNPFIQLGKFAFDTSTFEATILGNQTGMTVKYFDQNRIPLASPLPNPFYTETQNVSVLVENPLNTDCFATTTLSFVVNPLPIVNDITIVQCDDDSNPDGKTLFNLTVNNNLISENFTHENFTYYTTQLDANNGLSTHLISDELAFENTIPSVMYVWARVSNKDTGCFRVSKITLVVPATNLLSSYKIKVPPVCDDFLDAINTNRDGIATFDFSSTKAIILDQLPINQVYNVAYYKNQGDALAELNAISNTSNYRNIGYPNSQDIWVRIESNLDNACVGLGPYITLKVEALPYANHVAVPRQCEDNHDGIFTFDTTFLENNLLNGQTYDKVMVTYFDQNGLALPSPFPATFRTTTQTIKAIVTNKTQLECFDETLITFTVDNLPEAFVVDPTLTTACDDELDPLEQDGKFTFDTSTFENIIIGTQKNSTVTYTLEDGTILSTLAPTFKTSTQKVLVTVTNLLNSSCSATKILNFVVNPIPKINLNTNGAENELVCSNIPTFFITLDVGIQDRSSPTDYNYIWAKDGKILSTDSSTLVVNTKGDYTVEVTSKFFGCSRKRSITVNASDIATIDTVEIVDLADENSVTVMVTGSGNYEYSLDEPNGFWQESNFFNNVPAGIHDVYIKDKNGCGIVSKTIAVIGAPKFFTPNNDGYNDYWNIEGINGTFNSKSTIYIYDRYGKLLKQWVPTVNQGWNGTINGNPLPADDYWFTLKLEDGREAKGHFSLKR
jgi:gliding motility-associated-like protein